MPFCGLINCMCCLNVAVIFLILIFFLGNSVTLQLIYSISNSAEDQKMEIIGNTGEGEDSKVCYLHFLAYFLIRSLQTICNLTLASDMLYTDLYFYFNRPQTTHALDLYFYFLVCSNSTLKFVFFNKLD